MHRHKRRREWRLGGWDFLDKPFQFCFHLCVGGVLGVGIKVGEIGLLRERQREKEREGGVRGSGFKEHLEFLDLWEDFLQGWV